MSSCQGELPTRKFTVRAIDQEGNVLVNKTVTTLRNGFFELWLPRNRKIKLTVRGMNRTARGKIYTSYTSKTCITTFKLTP